MKTKKSGVRGSVITSADLEKAIKELEGVASGRVKLFGPNEFSEPVAGDGPLARALLPFDKAAAGAVLKSDDKTLSKLAAMWFDVCGMFDHEGWLNMSFNLMWNGFINAGSVWMCPQVFGGDYGVFRFNLSKAVRWSFYAQGGAKKDVDRIVEIENGQKRRDTRIRKTWLAASEAVFRTKGELTEGDICKKQERCAVSEYVPGESLTARLLKVLNKREIDGFKIDGDSGWVGLCIKEGFIERDCKGVVKKRRGQRDLGQSNFYARVHNELIRLGTWKKKGNRKSRKNRA